MTVVKYMHVIRAYWVTPIILGQQTGLLLIILVLWMFHPAMASDRAKIDISAENKPIVLCLPTGIDSLDPTSHRSRITQIVLKNIFDSLTTRDNTNKVIPQLAESWRLIEDTQWQFKLREDILFHNGQKLSADDVKFTIERVICEGALDGDTSPRKNLLEPISKIIVVDDHTVNIKTRHPWPNLPLMLSLQEIVPSNYMQTVGSKKFRAHPVGTGPFKVLQADSNKVILERFDGYYGGSPDKPPVQVAPMKQIIFKVVPSHLDQLAMLKTGQCDIIFNIAPESIPVLEMSPGIRVLTIPATRSYFAEINCSKPSLKDFRIRQALNYAVDMEMTVRHKLQGQGKVLSTVLLPNAFGYNPYLQPYPYNPSIARHLLDETTYPDRPLVIYFNNDNLILADSIALYLTKLGLQTRMTLTPSFRPQTLGPKAPWDIFVGSWGNSTLDPAGILPPKFKSGAYGNFSGFNSPPLDGLLLQAQSEMDEARRTDYYHQIQSIIFNEAPMIFGYAPDEFYAITERVKNFKPSATGMIELHDVYVEKRE